MDVWSFPKTDFISDTRMDNILKRFHQYGIQGLVRENIQNALDANRDDLDDPVIVKITIDKIHMSQIPGHDEIMNRVKSLKKTNMYNEEVIENMRSFVDDTEFNYISFEDFNTKGLLGGDKVQSLSEGSSYTAYAYQKGVHVTEGDQNKDKVKGGSHGVGKIASNSASIFHTMFFANCDENNYKTLGGNVHLIEHEYKSFYYRESGYFAEKTDEGFKAYMNTGYDPVFSKDTRGLKIVIPYAKSDFCDEDAMITTVCDSFLVAINNGKLIVDVNGVEINQENLVSFLFDDRYFIQDYDQMREHMAPIYFRTLENKLEGYTEIADKERYHKFHLYFTYDPEIVSGRTGIFRSNGMKIEDMKIRGKVSQPYNAILIPKTPDEDMFLKSLENESHTKIDSTSFTQQKFKDNAKRFINNLHKEISKVIEDRLSNETPDTDEMNTDDILYELENKFAEELKDRVSVLNISVGREKKNVVKTKDTKEKGTTPRTKTENKQRGKGVRLVKKTLGDEGRKEYYQLSGGIIKRLTYDNTERLEIDISSIPEINAVENGNLLISMIDGMGEEHSKEYDLREDYYTIDDLNAYEKLKFDKNQISSVLLTKGKISLQFKMKRKNNTSKLKYYLEV